MKVNINWNMCRVCLAEIDVELGSKSIFEVDGDKIEISSKIADCGGIDVIRGVNLPDIICNRCVKHLNIAFKFRNTCKQSNERLQAFVNKANNFLLSEALEQGLASVDDISEDIDIPEINTEEDNIVDKVENDNDFVEYIIEEDEEQIEDEYESETIVAVLNTKDEKFNDIKLNLKNEEIESQTETEETYELITDTFKDSHNLMVDDDNSSTVGAEIYELQIPHDLNKETKPKRKYTKKDPTKSFACNICGNKFKHKYSMDIHMRLHTNEKPFVCEICSKDFALNFQLSRHMRIHTGEKPYSCKYCDRKFRDISTRIKHERIHTNERPFKCPHCPKDFIYSDVCKRHISTHTGEKPYECVQCEKKFAQSHHLKAHLLTLSHRAVNEEVEELEELFDTDDKYVTVTSFNPTMNTTMNEMQPRDLIQHVTEVITLN